MTQLATPQSVRADFSGVHVDIIPGSPMELERRGEEFWASFDDPGWEGDPQEQPRITRQVVMITGSHHQNIYWYATEHQRTLNVLPAVYLLNDERWVPRNSVILSPPNQGVATHDGHWNAVCISCHTTHGKTQFDTPYRSEPITSQEVGTTVAEFGIACESCHGPASDHVTANQNPWRRYGLHFSNASDQTITEPTSLDPKRSSEVCGQCHSVWEFYDVADERSASANGLAYQPGDTLTDTRFVAQPTVNAESTHMRALLETDPDFVRGSFWPDCVIRVSGREYNGLVDSPCFFNADSQDRTFSCFSCHNMHKDPDDLRPVADWADTHQLAEGMETNSACQQCHPSIAQNVPSHTNHSADSSGSSCYNCHMPYTSYGLMRAIRSHTITSPSVEETVDVGRPNACNLCHLDQTLAWTGNHLEDWYGGAAPDLNEQQRTVAASILWLLKGDAGQRALAAWSYGWQPSQSASGTEWMVPYLAELLGDPYDVVRYISANSIKTLAGYEGFSYDFVGPRDDRIADALELLNNWRNTLASRTRQDPQLLFGSDGQLDTSAMRLLFDQRNQRPLFLRE